MGFDQYHEPPSELSPVTRTFARLCTSLTEEAEAIGDEEPVSTRSAPAVASRSAIKRAVIEMRGSSFLSLRAYGK